MIVAVGTLVRVANRISGVKKCDSAYRLNGMQKGALGKIIKPYGKLANRPLLNKNSVLVEFNEPYVFFNIKGKKYRTKTYWVDQRELDAVVATGMSSEPVHKFTDGVIDAMDKIFQDELVSSPAHNELTGLQGGMPEPMGLLHYMDFVYDDKLSVSKNQSLLLLI